MRVFTSLLLSILILSGNLGLSFNTHYCFGYATKSVLVFGDNIPNCGMEDPSVFVDCDKDSIRRKSCCENRSTNFRLVDNQLTQQEFQTALPFIALDIQSPSTYIGISKLDNTFNSKGIARPPPDLQALFQVYTI